MKKKRKNLLLSFPGFKFTFATKVLAIVTVGEDLSIAETLLEELLVEFGKAPLFSKVDLLSSRELHFRSSKSLESVIFMGWFGSYTHNRLSNIDPGYVIGMATDSKMETFFTYGFGHVLVGRDTGGFKSLGTDLFVLVRYHYYVLGEGHD